MTISILERLLLVLTLPMISWSSGLTFILVPESGSLGPRALAAFQEAADRWSGIFTNDVTISLTVGMKPLGTPLSTTTNRLIADTYADVRTQLLADSNSASAIDQSVDLHLAAGPTIPILTNRTSDGVIITNDPTGMTPYTDNNADSNNRLVQMTYANARALGIRVNSPFPTDAVVELSSSYAWDFNPDDGITGGTYDFVGVATHEIAHALGFISGVDDLDTGSMPKNGQIPNPSTAYLIKMLDLFRYSDLSSSLGVIDFIDDSRSKFLSVDGGATYIAQFADGKNFGDGYQASHWKYGSGAGIMNPTAQAGQLLSISSSDIAALDAIGWNTAGAEADSPEPQPFVLCLIGLFCFVPFMLRRPARERQKVHPARSRECMVQAVHRTIPKLTS
jgi:hypothetical protein